MQNMLRRSWTQFDPTSGREQAGRRPALVVSPATFTLVSKTVSDLGLPVESLKQFKPWMIALTLLALEWQKAGFDAGLGIDKHFYDRAKTEGKAVQGLETVEFQISRFDTMTLEQQDRMLAELCDPIDRVEDLDWAKADRLIHSQLTPLEQAS